MNKEAGKAEECKVPPLHANMVNIRVGTPFRVVSLIILQTPRFDILNATRVTPTCWLTSLRWEQGVSLVLVLVYSRNRERYRLYCTGPYVTHQFLFPGRSGPICLHDRVPTFQICNHRPRDP